MTKTKNKNLHQAKKAKNDEFYTRLEDIEKELQHYRHHFKDKVVLCNCDDPRETKFFTYFSLNFEYLGLKRLICVGYKENGHGVKYVYEGDKNKNGIVDPEEIEITELKGTGDFRDEETIEILKESDIVVTNPPFSLFRQYIGQLMEYNKKFLIIGNKNAITYKEVFPLIKENKLWLGVTTPNEFNIPNGGITQKLTGLCRWFTNLSNDQSKQYEILYKKYTLEEYPKYDNYDAINVNKVSDIPYDYDGVMGVPITFLDKWTPCVTNENNNEVTTNDFEIVKFRKGDDAKDLVYTTNGGGAESNHTSEFSSRESNDQSLQDFGYRQIYKEQSFSEQKIYNQQQRNICSNINSETITTNNFEIIGQLNVGCYMDENGWQGSNGKHMLSIDGKDVYKRILIRKLKL